MPQAVKPRTFSRSPLAFLRGRLVTLHPRPPSERPSCFRKPREEARSVSRPGGFASKVTAQVEELVTVIQQVTLDLRDLDQEDLGNVSWITCS